ncbi:hypothetical protein EVAR_75851_1 [Eumeta japonica]|uniref:Uncharacterized protein n=1 Tax=Eumeta variegata TaxID=151549 RepID=A0A4C1TFT9_EUMVA|nr:hypothetical protein EVAR_75851_1 [Eumeta japonica]
MIKLETPEQTLVRHLRRVYRLTSQKYKYSATILVSKREREYIRHGTQRTSAPGPGARRHEPLIAGNRLATITLVIWSEEALSSAFTALLSGAAQQNLSKSPLSNPDLSRDTEQDLSSIWAENMPVPEASHRTMWRVSSTCVRDRECGLTSQERCRRQRQG